MASQRVEFVQLISRKLDFIHLSFLYVLLNPKLDEFVKSLLLFSDYSKFRFVLDILSDFVSDQFKKNVMEIHIVLMITM